MNKNFFIGATLYTLFVIYGSLVPLDYRPIPFDEALERFKNIRYLNLGIASRADWVANILLYIPLAYLWSACWGERKRGALRLFIAFWVLLFCWALAVSVEFAQQFFPPRTVSINDLIAEAIGSTIGVSIWLFSGDYFRKLYRNLSFGNLLSINAAIIFYVVVYFALSFFPFDFVISHHELEAKLASGNHDFWLSSDVCRADGIRCFAKLGAEIAVMIPLGILICLLPYITHRRTLCLLAGFFIGLVVEIGQLFLASGVAQGISVLTRMTGMGLGAVIYAFFAKHDKEYWIGWIKPAILTALPFHLLLVAALNGWFAGNWIGFEQAMEKLKQIEFLPFYYFYYTTESQAMVSLLSNFGMYVPIGVAYWLVDFADAKYRRFHWAFVGCTAAVVAVVIETGKLFLELKHPDPTDVLIAFASAAVIYEFLNRAKRWVETGNEARAGERLIVDAVQDYQENFIAEKEAPSFSAQIGEKIEFDKRWRWLSILLVSVIGWSLFNYPAGIPVLSAILAAYAYLLVRYPQAWLVAVPALLPVMDFAPWTGRFFFDEFDLVLLTTLAVYFWQKSGQKTNRIFTGPAKLCLGLFAFFYAISLYRGLFPLQEIDVNAFSNYYSHYNALRMGKGVVWAFLLLPLLKQTLHYYKNAKIHFGYGVLSGLAGVICVSIWERFLFSGLFNFESDYRITAMFSSMHTGGGHIDAYLVMALPFIAMLFLYSSHKFLSSMIGIGIFITGLYVLLVTFSRGLYLAFAVAFIVFIIGLLIALHSKRSNGKGKLMPLLGFMLLLPAITIPVLQGGFIQERFNRIDQDLDVRMQHWQEVLDMREDDLSTALFGMGVGSYPRTYFWSHSGVGMPATYTMKTENDNRYLSLGSGGSLYLDQYVAIEPETEYRLAAELRTESGHGSITIPICEKSLLYSFRCVWKTLQVDSEPGQWARAEKIINTQYVGTSLGKTMGELSRRPVKLGVYNRNKSEVIDIDNISLTDSSGTNLLSNGEFSEGTDFWFFTIDNHQALNIDNFWVHVLFDQGWIGVAALLLLLIFVFYRLIKRLKKGDYFAVILLTSVLGFFIIGTVGSPFEAPKLGLLYFLIVFLSLSENCKNQRRKWNHSIH